MSRMRAAMTSRNVMRIWQKICFSTIFQFTVKREEKSRSKRRTFVQEIEKIFTKFLNEKLTRPFEKREWLSKNCMKLKLRLRQEIEKREIPTLLFRRSIKNLNLNDFNYIKLVDGQISLRETRLACMENWNWEMDCSKKIMQGITQGSEDLRSTFYEETDRVRQARIDELSLHQERNPKTVSQLLTQIQELQNKVNSLSDAWEYHDPESRSSSGATPRSRSSLYYSESQNHASSRLWIAARYTENYGYLKKRFFFTTTCSRMTILYNFQQFKEFDILSLSGIEVLTLPKQQGEERDEMKRESLNTSLLSFHFQSRSDMLNHTDGSFFSQNYDRLSENFCSRNWILGNFMTLWNFKAGKPTSGLRFVPEQTILRSIMHWIKEVQITKSIDELVISRSIEERIDVPDFDMLDTMITSALKKLLNTQVHFRKSESVEEQRAQKSDRFLGGRRIAHMIHEHFCAIRNLWSSTRLVHSWVYRMTTSKI